MKRLLMTGLAIALAAAVGCGGTSVVPVSGVVRVNGQPYKNAVVSFQPLGTKANPDVGRGSAAVTDEEGRFTLVHDGKGPGALVGKHRVRIFTQQGRSAEDGEVRSGASSPRRFVEPIPAEWHELSTKEYDVPVGGTDEANFDIQTRSASKR